MPDLMFRIAMPDELAIELERASRECQISPAQFAAQAVEVLLAARRLPSVQAGKLGARMIGEPVQQERTAVEYREPSALSAGEIPTVDEVQGLQDIL